MCVDDDYYIIITEIVIANVGTHPRIILTITHLNPPC